MNTLLGQRIREQRKEKGQTIEQFAERVDLSANYVGDLERGVKIPKLETFIRIVEVLDVSATIVIDFDSIERLDFLTHNPLNNVYRIFIGPDREILERSQCERGYIDRTIR